MLPHFGVVDELLDRLGPRRVFGQSESCGQVASISRSYDESKDQPSSYKHSDAILAGLPHVYALP